MDELGENKFKKRMMPAGEKALRLIPPTQS